MIIALAVVTVLILLLIIPITAYVEYDSDVLLSVKLGFIKVFSNEKKEIEEKPEKEEAPKEKKEEKPKEKKKKKYSVFDIVNVILSLKSDILSLVGYVVKKAIRIDELIFKLQFGTGDAATTGILSGGIYGLSYSIVSVVHNNCNLKDFDIDITPNFEESKFDTYAKCVCRIRIYNVFSIAFRGAVIGIKFFLRLKKKGRK